MHNVAICPPICINQFDGARPFHVHHACTFSFNRLTLVRYSSECLARLVATLIYLLSIPFDPPAPWHRVFRALGKSPKPVRYIGIPPSGHPESHQYACLLPAVCVKRAFPLVCAHLRHVGSLFVPRAERPAVSAGLVLFVSLHPDRPLAYPA